MYRESKWRLQCKKADFNEIGRKYGIDPVLARIIRNRDVVGDEAVYKYLKGDLSCLNDPSSLKDANKAVSILKAKISEGKKIRIIGDYGIDGVCSTAILFLVLSGLGADIDYEIPDRIIDGYGLNMRLVEYAKEEGVDTILTCDNGISAVEQIAYAKECGMTVIVTDHHQPGDVLPPADAVIDPWRKDDKYPFKGICGAVVAWKLMQLLTGELLDEYVDLAGFATVGDVMDLQDENRIIVKRALWELAEPDRIGMKALIEANALTGKEIKSYHIGFILGPCINAGGRLDTAKRALNLILSEDMDEAMGLAEDLVRLNAERKKLTDAGVKAAISLLEKNAGDEMPDLIPGGEEDEAEELPEAVGGFANSGTDKVIVVYLPSCHESIAGIIAGRLRERYYRPSIVLTDSSSEGMIKGSARSIEEYHMYEGLCGCREYLAGFGGHPMAAGLSLKRENLEAFTKAINDNASLSADDLMEKKMIDVPVPIWYLKEDFIDSLSLLEPFGKGNEKPQFATRKVSLSNGKILGKNHNVFKCMITDEAGVSVDGIWFGDIKELVLSFWKMWGREETGRLMHGEENGIKADILYYPQVNEFRGWKTVQVNVLEFRKAQE